VGSGPQQAFSIDEVNGRIDRCLRENAIYERILWAVLGLMIAVGLSILVYAVLRSNQWLIGICVGETGLTVWPIGKLIQLHRRKIALSVIPGITSLLTARDAAREIHALVQHLLDKS